MEKNKLLYKGKAKSIYTTDSDDSVVMVFRDDTSAFNGERIEQLNDKGKINNLFNAYVMQKLADAGIPTHFEKLLSDNESLVKSMEMLPVECVVRNYAAGSLCRRVGLTEGTPLNPPTFELFYKDDSLGDPMVNESLAVTLGWATDEQLATMKDLTLKINQILTDLFDSGDLMLVDFKLEFGLHKGEIILGDEFSPDGCRLWDKATKKKLDKDRFRQGLGGVIEGYLEVANRIGLQID